VSAKNKKPLPPSRCFADIICDGGTPVVDCQFCGRTYYDFNGDNMEEGELERLVEQQKKSPKTIIPFDGQVSYGCLNGKQWVYGCDCNGVTSYENFIWGHKYLILEYFIKRTTEAAKVILPIKRTAARLVKALQKADLANRVSRTFDLDE
jgi:hypothetical protein